MKKHGSLAVALILLTLSNISDTYAINDSPFIEGQVWSGWYNCGEGKTKLKLTITKTNDGSRSKQSINAIYDFTTLKGVNGAFNTRGHYRSRGRDAFFMPVSWIKKPTGYGSPRFQGKVSADGEKFVGKVLWRGCSNFELFSPKNDYLTKSAKRKSTSNTPSTENIRAVKQTRLSPQEMGKQYGAASKAFNAGDLNAAEKLFNGILKHNPDPIMSKAVKKQLASIEQKRLILSDLKKDSQKIQPSANMDVASYSFEQMSPPAYGSHKVIMHFKSPRDVALAASNLDEIVKHDLVKRANTGGKVNRISGQYNFFVSGKEIEWRRYNYRANKGWDPVIGSALETTKRVTKPRQLQITKERFKYSIINQSADLLDSPKELASLFNLGFVEKGSIPSVYTFKETSKQPAGGEKWYGKRRVVTTGISYSIEVKVDDFNTLIRDRDNLVKYAKLDLQNRVSDEKHDNISAFYWFKSHPTNKHTVTMSLTKSVDSGILIETRIKPLALLSQGSEEEFTRRYRMSKAMFVAVQNGDKSKVRSIQKSRFAQVESASNSDSPELAITNQLSSVQKLPVLYMLESRKWNRVGGLTQQEVARKALDIHGFPMRSPLSPEQIKLKKRELASLINDLAKKGAQLKKTALRGKQHYPKVPPEQQRLLAEQVLYPAIMEIQSKTIDLLSRIPRTEKGLDEAYETNGWLSNIESSYRAYWGSLITLKSRSRGGSRQPHPLCEKVTTNQQVGLGEKTGRCYFEVAHSSRLLRNVWRLQYMRNIDDLISKQIKKNGADLYRKAFLLAYGLRGQDFDYYAQSNFSKWADSPSNSNKYCLFENCSSKLSKVFVSENSGKALSKKRKTQYLAILEKKSNELMSRWTSSRGQSKIDRYSIQSDIVNYARGVAKNTLLKLSNSAVKGLENISPDEQKKYKQWNKKVAKPIRLQLVKWRELWDIGFGITKKDGIHNALGLSNGTDSYLRARHSGGSPFNGIAEVIYNAQYRWLVKAEQGTTAGVNTQFPTSWDSGKSYTPPKRPLNYYAQLITPAGLFFEAIGNQVSNAVGALMSYGSQVSQLDAKIKKTRKEFFNCLPSCNNLYNKKYNYSKALTEKDVYFLKMSGRSGGIAKTSENFMGIILEGAGGTNGASFIDGGIPKICHGYFDAWVYKFGQANQLSQKGRGREMDGLFAAASRMAEGSFSALKEQGFKMLKRQQEAFAKSAIEYRNYQVCRDQYEFDAYE